MLHGAHEAVYYVLFVELIPQAVISDWGQFNRYSLRQVRLDDVGSFK